jgi:hypothetical protein
MAPSSTSPGGPTANALGTSGGILLSICLVPQLYRIYKTRSTTGEKCEGFLIRRGNFVPDLHHLSSTSTTSPRPSTSVRPPIQHDSIQTSRSTTP